MTKRTIGFSHHPNHWSESLKRHSPFINILKWVGFKRGNPSSIYRKSNRAQKPPFVGDNTHGMPSTSGETMFLTYCINIPYINVCRSLGRCFYWLSHVIFVLFRFFNFIDVWYVTSWDFRFFFLVWSLLLCPLLFWGWIMDW